MSELDFDPIVDLFPDEAANLLKSSKKQGRDKVHFSDQEMPNETRAPIVRQKPIMHERIPNDVFDNDNIDDIDDINGIADYNTDCDNSIDSVDDLEYAEPRTKTSRNIKRTSKKQKKSKRHPEDILSFLSRIASLLVLIFVLSYLANTSAVRKFIKKNIDDINDDSILMGSITAGTVTFGVFGFLLLQNYNVI